MTTPFTITLDGLTIEGSYYKGSTPGGGPDGPELEIESISFEVKCECGKSVWAELPSDAQAKLIDDGDWYERVWQRAEDYGRE